MKTTNLVLLAIIAFAVSACGNDDKADVSATTEASAPAAPAMTDSMATDDEAVIIDHSRDAAEFELRRSIGGLDRMIEQYTADGYATDELEAQKAELSASLDSLLGSG